MRIPKAAIVVLLCVADLWPARAGAGPIRAAETPVRVVLQPSDARGNPVPGPGYYQVTAGSGTTLTLDALVGNLGPRAATVLLAPVDTRSGVYGGISYDLPEQRRRRVGSWITLSRTGVHLRPGKAIVVPFTLHVPATARPGQDVGGLTAFVPSPRPRAKGRGALQIQFRRVVAVVVTVPGPSIARFTVGAVEPARRPQGMTVLVRLTNSGTTLLQAQGTLWVWEVGRRQPVIAVHLSVDTTVPHTTVSYPVPWTGHPAPGRYSFRVVTWWNGGHTSRTGSFTLPVPTGGQHGGG
ncbi:MAG: hypothetical protein JOZ41_18735 [Chloroflexi bacterium]|nr:hypothetical protein [Chloroflexota bacterium]